jgi:uncharacterized iron-regulated protein
MVMYLKKSNHCQGLLAPRLIVFVMLLCMSIISALGNAMANSPPCVPVGDWKVPDDGSKISETQLLNDLHKRPVVMLGETHTSAEHHKWQLHVLSALYGRNQNMVIGFEAFPRALQPILDRWTRGEFSKDEFIELTRWNEVWGYDPDIYMPLFDFARMHRIPMLALNVERSLIQKISRYGLASIPIDQRRGISTPKSPSEGYTKSLTNTFEMHSNIYKKDATLNKVDNKKLANFIEAQTFWDRAMAEAIAQARISGDNPLVVAIVGSGHVEYGYGISHQLTNLGISNGAVLLPWNMGLSCDGLKTLEGLPVAHAVFGVDTFTEQKKPYRPQLGVQIKTAVQGVIIIEVTDGSVAASEGLQRDDVIIQAAGTKINKSKELVKIIRNQAPGTYLPLRIVREGKELNVIAKFPTLNESRSLP